MQWVDNSELTRLNLWEGDLIFLPWLDGRASSRANSSTRMAGWYPMRWCFMSEIEHMTVYPLSAVTDPGPACPGVGQRQSELDLRSQPGKDPQDR